MPRRGRVPRSQSSPYAIARAQAKWGMHLYKKEQERLQKIGASREDDGYDWQPVWSDEDDDDPASASDSPGIKFSDAPSEAPRIDSPNKDQQLPSQSPKMTSINPQPLSFPPEIFAALTPAPFLLAHLSPANPKTPSLRANGRTQTHFRTPALHTNSLTHCSGSAVVRLGDTAVVCGIRGEILLAKDIPNAPVVTNLPDPSQSQDEDMDENEEEEDDAQEIADLNLLVPNIELSTGCSPAHLPGSPPSTLAQSLSQRLLSHLHSTRLLRASDLRILYRPPPPPDTGEDEVPEVEIKAYWTLYIDILVISLDGNIFDAAWFSILAALLDTTLPKAYYDADREAILCTHDARKLRLRGLPVPSTFAVFDSSTHKGVDLSTEKEKKKTSYILADPDTLEESLCKETLTIMVDYDAGGDAKIKGIEKVGGGVIGREEMKECTRLAVGRWAEWNGILMD